MKIRKLITGAIAAVCAAAALTLGASAYDLNTDLSTFWSASVTVPSSELIGVNSGSYVTITYTADKSVADMAGHDYWCIKPMINDAGWPLVDGITELEASPDGSSYNVDPDANSITFSIPAAHAEHVEIAGLAFMGHGITLETITLTTEAPAAPAETPAEAAPEKTNPDTGVEDIAVVAGAAVVAGGALVISRKRK